mmetsp:Transcript_29663/g.71282  ORF Transcript_29663/g.71282 Transcript_29663/m.71282 type:complete len:211 (-) Transcript_29663:45-677(-)
MVALRRGTSLVVPKESDNDFLRFYQEYLVTVCFLLCGFLMLAYVYWMCRPTPRLGWETDDRIRSAKRRQINCADSLEDRGFAHGLCGCADDGCGICCASFCCPALRWAETARLAGWCSFWVAVGVMAVVHLGYFAGPLGLILFAGVGTLGRQKARTDFHLQINGATLVQDFLAYLFCPLCAVAQEAQQYEDAWAVRHQVAEVAHYRQFEK